MRIKIRSILYCFGRSNASYYDPSIKHLGVWTEHFSWIVYWAYRTQWLLMFRLLVILYFFRYKFKDSFKKTAREAFFLWTWPIFFFIGLLSPFWSLFAYIEAAIYRNVNVIKWTNDWYIVGWFQYYIFYRYFRDVRYFFYLKVYYVELLYALKGTWKLIKHISEDEGGPMDMAEWRKNFDRERMEKRLRRQGLPIPVVKRYDIKHHVFFNKEVFRLGKLHYYVRFRSMYKSIFFTSLDLKKISKWF